MDTDTHKIEQTMVVYASPDGSTGWRPLIPEAVPEWVKEPDVMGNLANGRIAYLQGGNDVAPMWYRAEPIDVITRIQ